ncbi:DUF3499 family protein [Microterricola pindariensis]|uniref:Alcohol dehydrogenase n=1 Tax=Microterricola pindariensis TaxID=478010 RepID=A0ABX5AZ33_9MICO|nr:DUF3499 family protein [Microterricola pindariensis]PPL20178.1 alcohol dehydrogenase [Microterricola pindariensis]
MNRPCSKIACSESAVATLTYDYADSMAVLGPLSVTPEPHCYDLCGRHADRLSAPVGWQVVRHMSLASKPGRHAARDEGAGMLRE